MDVSLIITCWNSKDLLAKNLPSVVKAAKNKQNQIREIIVVDDFSTDGSVTFLKENYPQIKVIEHQKNFGYARTCNTGVKAAKGELVVILNADVVPSDNFLFKAFPLFKDKKLFSVTFNEGKYGPGKLVWKDGFWEIEATEAPSKTVSTDWPNGGSSIFRKDIWVKLGGMNELFLPFYFEDLDLGVRARKAGYQCLWEPGAKVDHKHETTINPQKFSRHNHKKNIALIKQRNHLLLTWEHLEGRLTGHLAGLPKRCLRHPGYLRVVLAAWQRKITYHPK